MGNIPCIERFQRGMAERAMQIAPDPRHVTQILRLAVAQVETGENAEDLAGALRGKGDIDLDESGRIEVRRRLAAGRARSGRAAQAPSARGHRRARPAGARRGRRQAGPSPHPGSRAGQARAIPLRPGSHNKLGEWKSRSTQVGGASIAGCNSSRQSAAKRSALGVGHGCVQPRQEPIEQQLSLDQEGVHVVMREAVLDMRRHRQNIGQCCSCSASSASTAVS